MSEKNNSIGLNELVDYQKKTYSSLMDKVMRFLWKCGGADAQILQYAPYSDHIKNAGIGGVVLATTVMAMMAMGFAMHTIFAEPDPSGQIDPITKEVILKGNWFITIPIAVIWGLIIFNLDRFIVSTVKGDGTEKITLGEWGSMLPRLFMAVLIGLTISAPLETYIFKREIQREWDNVSNKMAISRQYEIEQKFQKDLNIVRKKLNANDSLLAQANSDFKKYTDEVNELQGGTGKYAGKQCNRGEDCQNHYMIYRSLKKAEFDKNQCKQTNDSLSNVVATLETKKTEEILAEQKKIESSNPGFLDQIMMLEQLASHGKEVEKFNATTGEIEKMKDTKTGEMVAAKEEIYPSAFWPIWLVRLLFMIVEIAPVVFKFMIWKSSYDYMQDNVSQILEAKQGISLEHIVDEENKMHKVKENYNARRIVEVSKRQNELEKENAIHAITLYAEKEREEIEKNPEKFIQSTDPTVQEKPENVQGGGDAQQPKA